MDIEEIKKKNCVLEALMLRLVRDFEKETSMNVTDISILRGSSGTIEGFPVTKIFVEIKFP